MYFSMAWNISDSLSHLSICNEVIASRCISWESESESLSYSLVIITMGHFTFSTLSMSHSYAGDCDNPMHVILVNAAQMWLF